MAHQGGCGDSRLIGRDLSRLFAAHRGQQEVNADELGTFNLLTGVTHEVIRTAFTAICDKLRTVVIERGLPDYSMCPVA